MDVTDLMAHLLHLCDRHGLDREHAMAIGVRAYVGDMHDGPPVKRVT